MNAPRRRPRSNRATLNANFVRERLSARGLTQRELATRVHIELRTLQRWLSGARVDLDSAERIARELECGMGALCAELPDHYARPPLARLGSRPRLAAWLERYDASLAAGLRVLSQHWHQWASLVQFHGQPLERTVIRLPGTSIHEHSFLPLRLRVPRALERATLRFEAQVNPRIRFSFGEVRVNGDAVRLEEYAFTRALDGARDAEGRVTVLVWVSPDVRELVIASEDPFEIERFERRGGDPTLFDAADADLRGAVCFRPSAIDLRVAGLPAWDDRYRPA